MADESVFAAALVIANPAARAAYLDEACAGDPALRREVEALLAAHAGGSPLDRPPAGLEQTGAYPSLSAPGDATRPGDRIGPYKLLEKIGEGGMGEVWVAEQHEPIRRRVALKVIKPGMDSRAVLARFEAERQALALMDHPHIAKVLDAGSTTDRRPYFVMELVKGVPITEFCDARRLSPRERLELFIPVCQAIQHAHQKGVIHRDIKPSNVLVELHDDRPVPKVIDFGVAKAIGGQLTEKTLYTGFGALVGTPAYMAPEQATFNALDVDTRADVYALGVLLYELLAGSPPFEPERLKEAALDEVLRLVREEEPPRPSARLSTSQARASIAAVRQSDPASLAKLVRGELDWVVMKALEKDRARRYETASALARDVERYLKDEAVEACPPTLAYRVRKFTRKHRAALVWTVMLILILGGWAHASTWQALQLHEALIEAQTQQRAALEQKLQADRERERAVEAERKAVEEQRRADREARLAKGVQQFLVEEVLHAADPYRTGGKKPTVEDLLDRAGITLMSAYHNQPAEVELHELLSRTYLRLGKASDAKRHAQTALDLRRKQGADDLPETLVDQSVLADVLQREGKSAEAEKLFRETLAKAERLYGENHPVTLTTLSNLAAQLWQQKRFAEAEALTRRAYERQRAVYGPEHEHTLVSLMNLGVQILDQGRLAEAEPLIVDALKAQQKVHGERHPQTFTAKNNLGSLRLAQGRLQEAAKLYREVLDGAGSVLPNEHPHTRQTATNLASVLQRLGEHDEAEKRYHWVVDVVRTKLPQDEAANWAALDNLASHLEYRGRWRQAWEYRVDQYKVYQLVPSRNPRANLDAMAALARNATERQAWVEALGYNHGILDRQRKEYGEGHAETQATRERLGRVHLAIKEPAKAEGPLRDWLLNAPKLAPAWWRVHYVTSLLGEALLAQKKYGDAEPLLVQGYEGLKANASLRNSEVDRCAAEALARVVRLYEDWGKKDEAARWRQVQETTAKAIQK